MNYNCLSQASSYFFFLLTILEINIYQYSDSKRDRGDMGCDINLILDKMASMQVLELSLSFYMVIQSLINCFY